MIAIHYEGNLRCRAVHAASGESLHTAASQGGGGRDATFSPHDLLAAAVGTCVLTSMAIVAQRRGVDLSGARLTVQYDALSVPQRRLRAVEIVIQIPGGGAIGPEDRTRLQRAAEACPVKNSLHPHVEVRLRFLWDAEAGTVDAAAGG